MDEFTKIVEFDIFNPDNIGKLVFKDDEFKLVNWLKGQDKFDKDA